MFSLNQVYMPMGIALEWIFITAYVMLHLVDHSLPLLFQIRICYASCFSPLWKGASILQSW